jgi:chemotaxis protein histidine kinase CheA
MATVVKNFRIKSGLIVEGTTGTINGQNILTETGSDSYILNLVGGATLVKSVESTQLEVNGAGKLSIKSGVFDASGAAAAAQSAAEATASADATSKANAAASSAISAAATDATTKVAAEAALRVSGDAASVSTAAADATSKAATAKSEAIAAAATDATTKAAAAQAAAEATAAAALSTAISTEVTNRNSAISNAVDSLVDGAPALLNTLNELAAAINDDANYTTTLTSALATKANSADVTTAIATAKTAAEATASADATSKANAAQSAAEAYALGLAGNYESAGAAANAQTAAEGYADGLVDDVLDGTSAFTAVNVNDLVSQRAAQATLASVSTGLSVMSWAKASYGSAKLIVKFATATHTQVSEVVLSTDSSNNVAITEYATVGTNGDLGTVTASVVSGNIGIEVNTVNANTTVTVLATLIK